MLTRRIVEVIIRHTFAHFLLSREYVEINVWLSNLVARVFLKMGFLEIPGVGCDDRGMMRLPAWHDLSLHKGPLI